MSYLLIYHNTIILQLLIFHKYCTIFPSSDVKPTKGTAAATMVIGLMGLSTGHKISTTIYYFIYRIGKKCHEVGEN